MERHVKKQEEGNLSLKNIHAVIGEEETRWKKMN